MSKKIFLLLVIVMTIATIGIITVQVFWINSSIEIREKQFSSNVKSALLEVVKVIEKREFRDFVEDNKEFYSQIYRPKNRSLNEFFFQKYDTVNNQLFTYKHSILIDNIDDPLSILNKDSTSRKIYHKRYFSKKEKEIKSLKFNKKKDLHKSSPDYKMIKISDLSSINKLEMESAYREISHKKPIHKRISLNELQLNIKAELKHRGIETPFEYAIYDDGILTKVKSKNFKRDKSNSYTVRIFSNDLGRSKYYLNVNFIKKNDFILRAIKKILILSLIFILLIIFAFVGAIYQLLRQKRISQIKTDFINNMTHEFKTPIATINLALDAMRNPQVINKKEKVLRYAKMIGEENKRMHAQVENVLQIAKLEKNQLDISKEVVDVNDLLEDALSHIELIVQNKGGYVKLHNNAYKTEILGNEMHLTNILVNMLDNAMKYTNNEPKIDIFTENIGNFIVVKVKDQGVGMSKVVQKQIFEKFYRENNGNIHNVKGHGLGLSYVKSIVENHNGTISVESEKGKGSTFTLKLPLI